MPKRRIQIQIDEGDSRILEHLKDTTESGITEIIKNALILYDWAVDETKNDRFVMSSTANIQVAADIINKLKNGESAPEDLQSWGSSVQITKPILKGVNIPEIKRAGTTEKSG